MQLFGKFIFLNISVISVIIRPTTIFYSQIIFFISSISFFFFFISLFNIFFSIMSFYFFFIFFAILFQLSTFLPIYYISFPPIFVSFPPIDILHISRFCVFGHFIFFFPFFFPRFSEFHWTRFVSVPLPYTHLLVVISAFFKSFSLFACNYENIMFV